MSVRIVWNTAGFDEMRNSAGVQDALNKEAKRIAAAAGDGYAVDLARPGKKRAHARVYTDTIEAKVDQAKNHTLERAFGGG